VALAGISDLAEIAMICALNTGVKVIAVVDGKSAATHFVGLPVVASFDAIADACDAVLITDLQRSAELTELASAWFGAERVLTPKLTLPPPRFPNGIRP
jgi:hypothetical protein